MIPFLMGVIASAARQVVTPPVAPATSAAAASSYDRYFRETSLLLHGDGVDGAQVVTDSSLRVKVPTISGAVAIDTDQSKYGGSSIFFPGTTADYLEYTRDADYDFGTGDFTIEFWVRLSGYSPGYAGAYRACIAATYRGGGAAPSGWQVGIDGTASSFTGINVYTGATTLTFAQSFSLNTWYHVAISRASGTVRAFVDGVLIGSVANSDNFTAASDITHPLRIGRLNDATYLYQLTGHLDDFRITKGVARYTSGFVPARCADIVPDDPYWSSNIALLHMDGANASTNVIDSCYSPLAFTCYGNAALSTARKKYGSASCYFDGSGDYVSTPDNASIHPGSGDYTWECWACPDSGAVHDTGRIMGQGNAAGGESPVIFNWTASTNTYSITIYNSSLAFQSLTGGAGSGAAGVWAHLALVKRGTSLSFYIDGVLKGSLTITGGTLFDSTAAWSIGRFGDYNDQYFKGWVDEVRLTRGVARYTAAFTPPADRHPDIVKADPYFTSVAMHLPFEGADGATTTLDESMIRKSVTFNGNAQIDTGYYKYGVSSCLLDGTGDYVALSGTPADWKFLHDGSRWTFEGWFRFTDVANSPVLISTTATTVDIGMGVYVTTGRQISVQIYRGVSSTYVVNGVTTGTIPNDSNFHHVAICYNHTPATGNCLVFIDGALAGTFNKTADAPSASNPTYTAWVGAFPSHPTLGNMNGNVDSIRITKGVCRYTSAFAVPLDTHPMYKLLDAPDAYFRNTSALLHLDSYNNSVSFVDSSLRKKAFTASGDAKHTTSLSRYGTSCLALDGTGDYISTPYNSEFDFSTGDFTVELWYRPAVGNVDQQLITYGLPSVATGADLGFGICHFGASVSGKIRGFFYSGTTAYSVDSLMTLTVGTWYHIALVRASGQMRLYIDGMLQGTVAAAPAINSNASYTLRVGYYHGTDTRYVNGHIDDLRITKAVCRYATDFIPERCYDIVVADPYWSSNTLMLHMDGADGMARVYDSAYNPKTMTVVGNAAISATQSKFGGTSCYFDGTGDGVTAVDDPGFNFGTDDATLEAWVYITDLSAPRTFFNKGDAGANACFDLYAFTDGKLYSTFYLGGSTFVSMSSAAGAMTLNTWHHVAAVRSGSTFRLFLNGVQVSSGTSSAAMRTTTMALQVGAGSGSASMFGYMDEVRITKGRARYTEAFTPHAIKHPDIVESDPYYTSVVTLLPFDLAATSTTFTDRGLVPKTPTATGNTAISVSQSKHGGASCYFDGNGDYLSLADDPSHELGSGDFTFEFWMYLSSTARQGLASKGADGDWATIDISTDGSGSRQLELRCSNGSAWSVVITTASNAWSLNTWHHVAATRVGSTFTLWIDGVNVGSSTSSAALVNSTSGIQVGRSAFWAVTTNGYVDDLRISSGVCRYSSGFTPPQEAFAYA